MSGLGVIELVVILFVVILIFGGKKIPELIRGIGDAVREFKRGANDED